MNYRKEFFLNFNISALVFVIPVILIIAKALMPCLTKCSKSDKREKKGNSYGKQAKPTNLAECKYLSYSFIMGSVFIPINLWFMNQITMSYFIEQAPNLSEG